MGEVPHIYAKYKGFQMRTNAPAKVQHYAVKLSVITKRTINPVWDWERRLWIFNIDEDQDCNPIIHDLLETEFGASLEDCDNGHVVTIDIEFRKIGKKRGLRRWKLRAFLAFDEFDRTELPIGIIAALLEKPKHSQSDGNIKSADSFKTSQSVRSRTSITRV